MTENEMREAIKGKSKEEIREFIAQNLIEISKTAENLAVSEEDYEKANELKTIRERVENKNK